MFAVWRPCGFGPFSQCWYLWSSISTVWTHSVTHCVLRCGHTVTHSVDTQCSTLCSKVWWHCDSQSVYTIPQCENGPIPHSRNSVNTVWSTGLGVPHCVSTLWLTLCVFFGRAHCLEKCLPIKNHYTESGYNFTPRKLPYHIISQNFVKFGPHFGQLGTFSVNGEWVCGGLFAVSAKSEPTGAEHVVRSQLDRYVLFLIQSVIIKCEIQCSYKRVITLLNNVYLTASYITYIHAQ